MRYAIIFYKDVAAIQTLRRLENAVDHRHHAPRNAADGHHPPGCAVCAARRSAVDDCSRQWQFNEFQVRMRARR